MRHGVTIGVVGALCAGWGCGSGEPAADAVPTGRETVDVALPAETELDLLFVLDNTMGGEGEAALARDLATFFADLAGGGELPDLHVGVVTSDLGTLDVPVDSACAGSYEGHLVKGDPDLAGQCTEVTGTFLSDVLDPSTMTRATNYTGAIGDAAACMVQVGVHGCGFEQPLEAMKIGLENADGFNTGFLRDTARLGVLVMADEDDCSAKAPAFFGPDSAELGPIDSFRCFEFGVTCAESDPRAEGPHTGCVPYEDSPYLYGARRYVDFLEGLRPAGRVVVQGLFGDPTPVAVGRRTPMGSTPPRPDLIPSCTYTTAFGNTATADAGVRLDAFVHGFAERGEAATFCAADYTAVLARFAQRLRDNLAGQPCLRFRPASTPPTCDVTVTTYGANPMPLAACDATASNPPCWRLVVDAAACPTSATQLRLDVVGVAEAPGRRVRATCDVLQ